MFLVCLWFVCFLLHFRFSPLNSVEYTLRVGNLSENAERDDLRRLFGRFGEITRCSVPRSDTGLSRGFGFVTFEMKEDAVAAMEKLNGHGYDHLILEVGWARYFLMITNSTILTFLFVF